MQDLNLKEKIALYLLLVKHEDELDIPLLRIKNRIEKSLFQILTVWQIEHLEEYYEQIEVNST